MGEAIVRGTGVSEIMKTDLTLHPAGKLKYLENTFSSNYRSRIRWKSGTFGIGTDEGYSYFGAPAVLVVVYGNRAYEKGVGGVGCIASERGFKVIAGGTFVGEHSYSTQQNPIAVGRPDVDDLQFAETFGAKIRTKIETAAEMDKLYAVDVNRIQRPYQAFFPLFRFLRKVVKLRKGGVPMPRIPAVGTELCNHCGYCAVHCPASAIKKGDECYTDAEKCIRCCACIKVARKKPYI